MIDWLKSLFQIKKENVFENSFESPIDKIKRDKLVQKYDLLYFSSLSHNVLVPIDEFFDGNLDEGSVAANRFDGPSITEFYSVMSDIEKNTNSKVYAVIVDVPIYKDGKLGEFEWVYTDTFYVIGEASIEEVNALTRSLKPDDVGNVENEFVSNIDLENIQGKNIIYIWWD